MPNNASPVNKASDPPSASSAPNVLRRLLVLLLCVVAGCAVGLAGLNFTGSSSWFLTVPLFILVAWVFVADPTECVPPDERSAHNGSASG